jgi:signal peptide peptidase SppA
MILLPHIAERVFNAPLLIDAGKAVAIISGLGGRLVDGELIIDGPPAVNHVAFANGRPSEQMGRLGDRLGSRLESAGLGDRILQMVGPVAVIPIEGTLVHKGGYIGASSGETSYEGIQTQVARARRDDRVRAVVFEVDSFGGEAAGAFDTADMIAELSAEKPTIAILTDFALSGGYLLAAAARQIIIPETGAAGSIGVVSMHVDMSRAVENAGMRVSVIASGKHKADGSPFTPLGDDVRGAIQARNDASRDLFASAVARYRGRRLSKSAALATEADVFRGEDAVDAGLADGVLRPSVAFEQFVARVSR